MPLFVNPLTATNVATVTNKTLTSTNNTITLDNVAGNPVHGTNTNDAAASGYVGEYISSTVGATNLATTNQYKDLTTITLTAGDWDICAQGLFTKNGATTTTFILGVGTATGNSSAGLVAGDTYTQIGSADLTDVGASISPFRVSLSGSTTYYLKIFGTYTVATPQAYGRISARRMR